MSKKIRFEIFRRDNFTCQYCGRRTPEVVLELDHIIPKSKGGKDEMQNYITACFDCNRGKGARVLSTPVFRDDLKNDVENLKEKNKQLKEYYRLIAEIEEYEAINVQEILRYFTQQIGGKWSINERSHVTIKYFLRKLSISEIKYAIDRTLLKFHDTDLDEEGHAYGFFKYFCAICHNMIKENEKKCQTE